MPPSLAKKFAGLPRWAWIAILAGGLTVGLVLRYRSQQQAAADSLASADDATGQTDKSGDAFPSDQLYSDSGYGSLGTYPGMVGPQGLGGGGFFYPPIVTPPRDGGGGHHHNGGGDDKPCGPRPNAPSGHRHDWECKNGRWQLVPARGHHRSGGHHPGHGGHPHDAMTGGGPPVARAAHAPLGGLPRGASDESAITFAGGDPPVIVGMT